VRTTVSCLSALRVEDPGSLARNWIVHSFNELVWLKRCYHYVD